MNLTDGHHAQQKMLARGIVADLEPLWGILDFHDLRGTTGPWLRAVRPVVERGYLTSQYVAAEFVKALRKVELPEAKILEVDTPNPLGPFGIHEPAGRSTQLQIMVAMKVTGPVSVANNSKPGMTDASMAEVMRAGFGKSSGAAVRIVLNGGRGMVRTIIDADPDAVGVQAVADEAACKSCRFLADTPLMKGTHTAKQLDAVAVGHDWCWCSAAPIFRNL